MKRGSHGFSLLEAIVAMALLGTVGMALLAWMNNNLQLLGNFSARQRGVVATREALGFLETINIQKQPSGEQQLGDWILRWQSEPVEPAKDGRQISGAGVTPFQLTLYKTRARVVDREQRELAVFDVRLTGHVQVRSGIEGLF